MQERILKAASLILQDYTIPKIANLLNSTPDIIYDDLTNRLKKLNPEYYEKVKIKLIKHRLENLTQYQENIPENIIEQEFNKDIKR